MQRNLLEKNKNWDSCFQSCSKQITLLLLIQQHSKFTMRKQSQMSNTICVQQLLPPFEFNRIKSTAAKNRTTLFVELSLVESKKPKWNFFCCTTKYVDISAEMHKANKTLRFIYNTSNISNLHFFKIQQSKYTHFKILKLIDIHKISWTGTWNRRKIYGQQSVVVSYFIFP